MADEEINYYKNTLSTAYTTTIPNARDTVHHGQGQPGDAIAVDALTYPGFTVLAQLRGLELVPLPAATDGPDLDALAQLCRTRRIRAIYTMPTMHNPLGWVTTKQSRERLVDIAREHGLLIIEDASYSYLVERPPTPVAALTRASDPAGIASTGATRARGVLESADDGVRFRTLCSWSQRRRL